MALLPITLAIPLATAEVVPAMANHVSAERVSSSQRASRGTVLAKPADVATAMRSDHHWKWIAFVWLVGIVAIVLHAQGNTGH